MYSDGVADDMDAPSGNPTSKGRATPSRREAELARRKQMKTALTRKELAKRDRKARGELRSKQQQAMRTGDEKFLPARERGPVRRFLRDYVDRRWNIAEFLLPILVLILLLSLLGQTWAVTAVSTLWAFTIVAVVIDTLLLLRGVKKQLAARGFDPADARGARFYALLRSTQLRRFRLPKPQVARGEALSDTYR